ncbi:hypothetical protein D3C85_1419990 [compost metagenome]
MYSTKMPFKLSIWSRVAISIAFLYPAIRSLLICIKSLINVLSLIVIVSMSYDFYVIKLSFHLRTDAETFPLEKKEGQVFIPC